MPRQRKSFTDLFSQGKQEVRATSRAVENSALRELQLEAALLDMDEQKKKPNLLQRKAFADYVNADVELTPKTIGLVFGAGPTFLAAAQSSRVSALQAKRERRREAVRIRLDELDLKEAEARALNRNLPTPVRPIRATPDSEQDAFGRTFGVFRDMAMRAGAKTQDKEVGNRLISQFVDPRVEQTIVQLARAITDQMLQPDGTIVMPTREAIANAGLQIAQELRTNVFDPAINVPKDVRRFQSDVDAHREFFPIGEGLPPDTNPPADPKKNTAAADSVVVDPVAQDSVVTDPVKLDKPKDVPFVPLGSPQLGRLVENPPRLVEKPTQPATAEPDTVAAKPAAAAKATEPTKPTSLTKEEQFELLKKARRRKGSKLTKADMQAALRGN